jgi:hypothetical protein
MLGGGKAVNYLRCGVVPGMTKEGKIILHPGRSLRARGALQLVEDGSVSDHDDISGKTDGSAGHRFSAHLHECSSSSALRPTSLRTGGPFMCGDSRSNLPAACVSATGCHG